MRDACFNKPKALLSFFREKNVSLWILWIIAGLFLYWMLKPSLPTDARLSPEAFKRILENGGVQIVDVRTSAEYRSGHLQGALSIPLDELAERLNELDIKRPVVAVCASGTRSAIALKILRRAGFTQSKHLEGGLRRWLDAGFAVQA
jgi:rhodanese-related sulfurtransferase